ncbi:MAG: cyclase family protein, partial [Acidimicrobiia bacterium]
MDPTWKSLLSARVIDLAQPLHRGMPVSPNHPSFQLALMRRHGDMVRSDGGSAANEIIVTGGHVGTHIDSLAHVSQDGRLHGGVDAESLQSN